MSALTSDVRSPTDALGSQVSPVRAARRPSDIDPTRLADLNSGRCETRNLAEWLAADPSELLRNVLPELGMDAKAFLSRRLPEEMPRGVLTRLNLIARAIAADQPNTRARSRTEMKLRSHPSDLVRQWGAFMVGQEREVPLRERLSAIRPYAADANMSVRECAWLALRPYVCADVTAAIRELLPWVSDECGRVRRFAVEVSRPRSVWGRHIGLLKREPDLALPLLQRVLSDPDLYVRRAVGNWLNDASRDRPEWVIALAQDWLQTSDTRETKWIVKRATRTLRRERKL